MKSLITYFTAKGFKENDLSAFLSCIKTRTFAADELILSKGQLENYLSFIDTGTIRYYAAVKDKEITFDFAFKNSFYCAYDSFYSRTKTEVYIQALTDCELYSISYEDLQNLYHKCETAKKLPSLPSLPYFTGDVSDSHVCLLCGTRRNQGTVVEFVSGFRITASRLRQTSPENLFSEASLLKGTQRKIIPNLSQPILPRLYWAI